jgi:HEAT repeat protein
MQPAGPALKDEELVARLIELLDESDPQIRQNIAVALANLGEAAFPALIDALNNPLAERRAGAATALGQIRPPAKSAIPALIRIMKDKDPIVRREASYALSRIVGQGPQTTPAVTVPLPNVPPPEPPPSFNGATP